MLEKYLNFIRCISIKWYGKIGVILTTSSFITMVLLEFFRIIGSLNNAYIGLITYLLLPTLFIIGLVLIFVGWFVLKRETGKSIPELLATKYNKEDLSSGFYGSRIVKTIAIFTLINVIFLAAVFLNMFKFMDQAEFCGTACHSVMNPEWVTYQQSPHSRVDCVECHVGEGVDALVSSKMNGVWQMISITFDLYERPIPTPVHQLRPARETCEKCHWPNKFYGSKLRSHVSYANDEQSTPKYTTLNMKIDGERTAGKAGIHWHVADENEVRYAYTDEKRTKIAWAEVKQTDGTFKRYTNQGNTDKPILEVRSMDCVDCHNRATHIYQDPEDAIDIQMRKGLISRELPFIKREALAAVSSGYADKQTAMNGIENHLADFYRKNYPDNITAYLSELDKTVKTLQDIYNRNIHHEMNIGWNAYPSHLGHKNETNGCFRCHNSDFKSETNESIKYDCTLCHSILADEQDQPFKFLLLPDTLDPDYEMHKYLQKEFINSYIE